MNCKAYHEAFLQKATEEGFIHEDHIHPVIIFWMEFTQDTKKGFVDFLNGIDSEFAKDTSEYLDRIDITKMVAPIYFPFEFESDEQFDDFMAFLDQVKTVATVHGYSVLSEIFIKDDDECDCEEESECGCGCGHHHDDEDNEECECGEDEECDCGCGCHDENETAYPSLFTEGKDGKCYMTTFNYDTKEVLDDFSGEFEKDDDFVAGLRLPITL